MTASQATPLTGSCLIITDMLQVLLPGLPDVHVRSSDWLWRRPSAMYMCIYMYICIYIHIHICIYRERERERDRERERERERERQSPVEPCLRGRRSERRRVGAAHRSDEACRARFGSCRAGAYVKWVVASWPRSGDWETWLQPDWHFGLDLVASGLVLGNPGGRRRVECLFLFQALGLGLPALD